MTTWDTFFRAKCIEIFTTSTEVIDVGGSLRLNTGKSNRVQSKNDWLVPYVKKVNYRILDAVPDYNPDIVGDIHNLPFADNTKEAIICIAVLEHVENPIKAVDELYRSLKPGGKVLIYVPFLYYYHAHKGYYGDYWRFTYDTMVVFGKKFSSYEIEHVRLPIETLVRLTPLGRYRVFNAIASFLDTLLYKKGSRQVSGYYLYATK